MSGMIDKAEALVAATAELGGDKLIDIRAGLERDLESAREHLERLEAGVQRQATSIEHYVHDNPWQAIGVTAIAAVVTGALASALMFRH